ncbi:SAM-dependent methyltransferase, partial [Candidatus Gottesmanbacteria bacterium CG_4_10_14_0_8_um_filter_37_24]
VSDKKSEGRMARMENRGRNEFPLFLAIKARKIKK